MKELSVRLEAGAEAGAEADLHAARDWYEQRDPVLAMRFLEHVAAALEVLAESRHRWPLHPGISPRLGVRRHVMAEFPFTLPYMVVQDAVVVLAVAHTRRRFGYWRKRRT